MENESKDKLLSKNSPKLSQSTKVLRCDVRARLDFDRDNPAGPIFAEKIHFVLLLVSVMA